MINDYNDVIECKSHMMGQRHVSLSDVVANIRLDVEDFTYHRIRPLKTKGESVVLESEFDIKDVPEIRGDEFMLWTAFDNIVRNSVDSLRTRRDKRQPGWFPKLSIKTDLYEEGV